MIPIRFVWRFGIWDLLVREQILCVMEQVLVLCVQRLLVGSTLQYFLDTQRVLFPGRILYCLTDLTARTYCITVIPQMAVLNLAVIRYRTTGDGSFQSQYISSGWLRTNRRIHFNSFQVVFCGLYSFNWTLSYFGVYLSILNPLGFPFQIFLRDHMIYSYRCEWLCKTFTAIIPRTPLTVNCQEVQICYLSWRTEQVNLCNYELWHCSDSNYSWTKTGMQWAQQLPALTDWLRVYIMLL